MFVVVVVAGFTANKLATNNMLVAAPDLESI